MPLGIELSNFTNLLGRPGYLSSRQVIDPKTLNMFMIGKKRYKKVLKYITGNIMSIFQHDNLRTMMHNW